MDIFRRSPCRCFPFPDWWSTRIGHASPRPLVAAIPFSGAKSTRGYEGTSAVGVVPTVRTWRPTDIRSHRHRECSGGVALLWNRDPDLPSRYANYARSEQSNASGPAVSQTYGDLIVNSAAARVRAAAAEGPSGMSVTL